MQTCELLISLPEPVKDFVDDQVASGGYHDASEYIQALLREIQRRQARRTVETLLEEGLRSSFSDMTDNDWARLKDRVRERQVQQHQ